MHLLCATHTLAPLSALIAQIPTVGEARGGHAVEEALASAQTAVAPVAPALLYAYPHVQTPRGFVLEGAKLPVFAHERTRCEQQQTQAAVCAPKIRPGRGSFWKALTGLPRS